MMTRRSMLLMLGMVSAWFSTSASAQQADSGPPSFVVILADDLGWSSLSFPMDERFPDASSGYHTTPNLAALASQSTRFPNAYAASPVCSPTRYSILLGQTPARLGKTIVSGPNRVDHDQLGIPDVLKSINDRYSCAHLGKWHIDADPESFGYDVSDGRTTNKDGGFTQSGPDRRQREWGGYSSDDPKRSSSVTSRAIDYLTERSRDDRPFFLQISYYAVHSDIVYSEESMRQAQARTPGPVHDNPGFAAMLADLDANIGRLHRAIQDLGLDERTFVFFLSDNGGVPAIPPAMMRGKPHDPGFNAPLRRGKWDLTEGGIRVPFMVSGPGVDAGSQCDAMVSTIDIMPTLADLAGDRAAVPPTADGGSLAPLLTNPTIPSVERTLGDTLVFHFPHWNNLGLGEPHSAVRQGRYKLLRFHISERSLLFDLWADIGEQHDLSLELPDKSSELEAVLENYLTSVQAEKPEESFSRRVGNDGLQTTSFLKLFE